MAPRPNARFVPLPARAAGGPASLVFGLGLLLMAGSRTPAQELRDQDRIDITGRQNLTLGSGARAYGMGGAFLARADDGTAASWNPAGLSYLRVPEVSLVGVGNTFNTERGVDYDRFEGRALDFAAFTWPVAIGEVRGAVQLSYQRSISFDGRRLIRNTFLNSVGETTEFTDEAITDGGFDVVAFGTGFRLTRRLRAGVTVNRWLSGYHQVLTRRYLTPSPRPLRKFDLDFCPRGWSFNLGLMWSPIDQVNLAAVYKTRFTADVGLEKARRDFWGQGNRVEEVTRNTGSSESVGLDFPASVGFGVSWRPRDTLTLSADFTSTSWSRARILDYFELEVTPRSADGDTPAVPPPPVEYPELQYPTLLAVPDPDDPDDPTRTSGQQNAEQIRFGVEYVLIKGRLKVPLRAGYYNDRQITPTTGGKPPRFNGFTVGTGIILGSLLLDVAYVHEFGDYFITSEAAAGAGLEEPAIPPVRSALTTDRFYASVIYRFSGRWRP